VDDTDESNVAQDVRPSRFCQTARLKGVLEVVYRIPPFLPEFYAFATPPLGDLRHCLRPALQDPAFELVVELAVGDGGVEVSRAVDGEEVQGVRELFEGGVDKTLLFVLEVGQVLAVDEAVQDI
jgi:hypothetical protein